jgi:hypothetical protein
LTNHILIHTFGIELYGFVREAIPWIGRTTASYYYCGGGIMS